jgi:hypothetical protein
LSKLHLGNPTVQLINIYADTAAYHDENNRSTSETLRAFVYQRQPRATSRLNQNPMTVRKLQATPDGGFIRNDNRLNGMFSSPIQSRVGHPARTQTLGN